MLFSKVEYKFIFIAFLQNDIDASICNLCLKKSLYIWVNCFHIPPPFTPHVSKRNPCQTTCLPIPIFKDRRNKGIWYAGALNITTCSIIACLYPPLSQQGPLWLSSRALNALGVPRFMLKAHVAICPNKQIQCKKHPASMDLCKEESTKNTTIGMNMHFTMCILILSLNGDVMMCFL